MIEDKKNMSSIWLILAVLFTGILISDYLFRFGFIDGQQNAVTRFLLSLLFKMQKPTNMLFMRCCYLAGLFAVSTIAPSAKINRDEDPKNVVYYISVTIIWLYRQVLYV